MATVLILDDDEDLRAMLCQYLEEHAFSAVGVSCAANADPQFSRRHIDLLVLDINMPEEDGLSFLARLRRRGDRTPILILSGRAHEADRVRGLELGADDYLVKPFGPRELLARVQALLRRLQPQCDNSSVVRFGEFRFDLHQVALYRGNEEVTLSSGERALMKVFASNPRRTLSRQNLLSLLGDEFGKSFERSIDVRVTRLRARLGDTADEPVYIRTVRGQGYCFTPTLDHLSDTQRKEPN